MEELLGRQPPHSAPAEQAVIGAMLIDPSCIPDVIEKVKIVTIADIREKDYSLAINNYIEKKEQETVPPEEIRRQYFEAYDEMIETETRMRELLLKGGYVSE